MSVCLSEESANSSNHKTTLGFSPSSLSKSFARATNLLPCHDDSSSNIGIGISIGNQSSRSNFWRLLLLPIVALVV